LSTNWIHLLGFFATTYVSIIAFHFLGLKGFEGGTMNSIFLWSFISVPLLFFTYGLLFIGYFYLLILTFDIIGFSLIKLKTIQILLLEWVLIIPPFIYWALKYDYWLWLTLAISFLITQLLRKRKIERIKNNVA
jgi:hypothetical protein